MTRDFFVVSVYSNEQTSIWSSWAPSDSDNGRNETEGFLFGNIFNLRGCAGVAATGARDVPTIAHPLKTFTAC